MLPGLDVKQPVTVRWSALERMKGEIGLDYLLHAKSVEDLDQRLTKLDVISLNYVMADTQGHIGWRVTGAVPIRSADIGKAPSTVRGEKDLWVGWILGDEMPHLTATKSGWIGSANHNITPKHYPYYLSNWFAPPNRIRRMKELINSSHNQTLDQSWQYMRDTLNVTAKRLTPFIVSALSESRELKPVVSILEKWNFHDDASLVAPTIYHQIYQALFREIFTDDLGEELVDLMLQYPYFWNERLEQIMFEAGNDWVDDKATASIVETIDVIIQRATRRAVASLSTALGDDPSQWRWGDVHTIEFLNPIRRSGIGKGVLGGGEYAMSGSGDTLYRAAYSLSNAEVQKPVTYAAAARMVFDLSDNKKVLGVIPGGQSGRTFSPYYTDQISSYMNGEKIYWWFDEALIREHRQSEIILYPKSNE